MTQQEILEAIYPVIRLHTAEGDKLEVKQDEFGITITDKDGPFSGKFIRDFAAVCDEKYIGFAIGAQFSTEYHYTRPYIIIAL